LSVPVEAEEKQPPDQCIAAASSRWTRQEVWVWKQLCLRQDADLNESGRFGATTDVDDPTSWSPQRILRPSFIESILMDNDYSDRLENRPIIIDGAWFHSPINLDDSSIPVAFYLNNSRFDAEVSAVGADIDGNIGFSGSTLKGELNLNGAKVEGRIFLREKAEFQDINLTAAKVNGSIYLSEESKFQKVNLTRADIGGNLDATGSTFKGELRLIGAKVGADVLLRDRAEFQAVYLDSANVDGDLDATGSTFKGELDLYAAQIKRSVKLYKSNFKTGTTLAGATIGAVLSLSDQRQNAIWDDSATMDLEGTTVRSIDDAPRAWPRHLRLAGFIIQQTHGQGIPLGQGFTDRQVSWYLDWLDREGTFTREPYTLLENLLRTVGRNPVADDIAMERMDHEYGLGG
jgi:hypothetical protein